MDGLLREIKRANKKANKLRRAFGFKDAKSKCTKKTLIKVVSYEDFLKGQDCTPHSYDDYVILYERDDGYYGAERITDGELKEVYVDLLPIPRDVLDECPKHTIQVSTQNELDAALSKNDKINLEVNGSHRVASLITIPCSDHLYFMRNFLRAAV